MQTPTNDILNQNSLCAALGKDAEGLSVYVFEELDSTNTYAKRIAIDDADARPLLIVAERQTAGRGRMGRDFFSPDKTGVYFSISYTAHAPLESAVTVTCAASVAVMRAIRRLCGVQTEIKWVNDLYLNGKKVCGILTEAVSAEHATRVIVGVGINLSTAVFPIELTEKAGALGCTNVSRAEMIAAVWQELKPYFADVTNASWLQDYRSYSCVIGKEITWMREEEHYTGTATGIDDSGALAVRMANGDTEYLRTGEISVRLNNKTV